ncbi:MAG: glycosyltransferase family 4 protein [Candidatus Anstonellaceae archaeon]
MHIAMFGWEFPPYMSGGLGVHCYELTNEIAKLGHKIDFYLPYQKNGSIPDVHENIKIIMIGESELHPYFRITKKGRTTIYGEDLLKAVFTYASLCTFNAIQNYYKNKYDVIHCHDWLTAWAGIYLKQAINKPFIQTIHSTEFERTLSPWEEILRIEKTATLNADRVIAVSNKTAALLMEKFQVPKEKIRVVYNGVNKERYNHKEKPKTSIALQEKKKVLFLGRLTEQKGPVQFLHAAKKVLEKNPDVVFLVAGSGPLLPFLVNLALELKINKNVKFLGYLSEEEQRKIYAACDVFVMPSVAEPFGIVALEAIASGTPVIISKTSGVSEILKSALKIEFWDINGMAKKILACLKYPVLKKEIVRQCIKEIEPYTWEKTAKETLEIYKEISN